MLTKLRMPALLAIPVLVLLVIFVPPRVTTAAQTEGAPTDGVRIENSSGRNISFTLKNDKTDWVDPLLTLDAGDKMPYMYRNEIKMLQPDGSFTYEKIPLDHVYTVTSNQYGWLEIRLTR